TAGSALLLGESAIRGGCSPLTRASPATLLTRTGAPKVTAASRLTDAKMSVVPAGSDALHATTTKDPSVATVGVELDRPLTNNVDVRSDARVAGQNVMAATSTTALLAQLRTSISPPIEAAACRQPR